VIEVTVTVRRPVPVPLTTRVPVAVPVVFKTMSGSVSVMESAPV